MFKVLLVDDEPIIREGLKTLIKWEEHGYTICGEAVSGRDGLKKVCELKPDLVFVDIRMPGIDGLQMIQELKSTNTSCKFIILSGYSEFGYAQKALELGAYSYILKPINKTELEEKVDKIYSIIEEAKQKNEDVGISKEKIIVQIMTNDISVDELGYKIKRNALSLSGSTYQSILIYPDSDEKTRRNTLAVIKTEVEDFLMKNYRGYSVEINGMVGVLISDSNFTAGSSSLKLLHKRIKAKTTEKIIISVGQIVEDMMDIHCSYEHALSILSKKFVFTNGDAILDGTKEKADIAVEEEINQEKFNEELYMSVDVNGIERIKELLDKKSAFMREKEYSEEDIKTSYANMYVSLIKRILLNNSTLRDNELLNQDILGNLYKTKSLDDLNTFVFKKLTMISKELDQARPDSMINKIVDYINRNYSSDIKLDTIATIFNYSSSYLGKMFKNLTGEPFNNCVEKVRIEKAKKFLDEGYKVYQVSEMVGYHDKDYFVSKFKKYVGIPPIAYKNRKNKMSNLSGEND